MEPLVYILGALWLVALLVCCASWLSCCACGLCCPQRLQRCLALLSLLLLVISLVGTLAATHKLKAAFAASATLAHDTLETARFAQRLAKDLRAYKS